LAIGLLLREREIAMASKSVPPETERRIQEKHKARLERHHELTAQKKKKAQMPWQPNLSNPKRTKRPSKS
jgi:hypothetical protein